MKHLKLDVNYNFLCSREFGEAINAETSRLEPKQQQRCSDAAKNLVRDFRNGTESPSLERLGDEDSNLYIISLKNSNELSIVLAIEEYEDDDFDDLDLNVCVLANAGTHSDMKQWAESQYYDFDPILAIPLDEEDNAKASILDIALQNDFEAWKFFLHPEQKYFAHETWAGPVYIAGAAGTGKTVIGLHYAATLVHRYPDEKILFTTKRSALLKQFEGRFRRLPENSANVDFIHIDDLAYNILKADREQRGIDWRTLEDDDYALWKERQKKIDEDFFKDTYGKYDRILKESTLGDLGEEYLKNEIVEVILGGGISSREEYRCSKRWGRLRRWSEEECDLIWSFYLDWNRKVEDLDRDGCTTRYVDRLDEAYKIVTRNEPEGRYRSVIVDEAQDMSLAGMKLVRALVAGACENPLPEDSMLILGDEAQQILPGGFHHSHLKQISIDIGERLYFLSSNYRNTEDIYEAARRVRGLDCVTGKKADLGSVQTELKGEGEKPQFVKVRPNGDRQFVGDKIREILENIEGSQIGVLTRDRDDAEQLKDFLEQERGLSCTLIAKGDATGDGSGIRVGSFETTKGLEFRVVLIPYLAHSRFPILPSSNDGAEIDPDETKETRLLERGYLYAAMTRARDQLYLIADDEPCEEIVRARDYFEWRDMSQ